MGIYIKGFEDFTGSCGGCFFQGYDHCILTGEYIGVGGEYQAKCPCTRVPDNAEIVMMADGLKMVFVPIK